MQVSLEVAQGQTQLNRILLKDGTLIGRSASCNLRITSSRVSRQHCMIFVSEKNATVRDFGSANGTYVNGSRIPDNEDVPLTSGTHLTIGPMQFVVHINSDDATEECSDSTQEFPSISE